MSRRRLVALGLVAALGVGAIAAFIVAARVQRERREAEGMAQLRERYAELRGRLAVEMERDPILALARSDTAEVAVAMSESLLVEVVQQVAARYLDRIVIDLRRGFPGHGRGDYRVGTPFGRLKAGEWRVRVRVLEMKGTIAAHEPTVRVTGTNRVRLALPAQIEGGRGSLQLAFAWDSKSIFNLVCRDFETVQVLDGAILPQRHVIRGDWVLAAREDGIVADPDFPPDRFPVAMALTDATWARLREALEKQDKFYRCGLMMKPEQVIESLRQMGLDGLRFRLPPALFRSVMLPASLSRSVRILDAPVALDMEPHDLRITPGLVWYSAEIEARRSQEPAVDLPLPSRTD